MTINYSKRVIVSKDGECPMRCAHCFTYELPEIKEMNAGKKRSNEEIVSDLHNEQFDIIYVSHTYESFYDEKDGIELCEMLYDSYEKDILIITRNYLTDKTITMLSELNEKMRGKGHRLYLAVSCFASNSYGISEKIGVCPTPEERLSNLERAHNVGIDTLLILRPIFPNSIVRTEECTYLVEQAKDYINAVVSSGLIVTDQILRRLNLTEAKLEYLQGGDSDYIKNMPKENAHFLNVENELGIIQRFCEECKVPFFRHSMPALNYILSASR